MIEKELISVLSDKNKYAKFYKYVNSDSLTSEAKTLFKFVGKYFEEFPAEQNIDWSKYKIWFFSVANPSLAKDKSELFSAIIKDLGDMEGEKDEAFEASVLKSFVARAHAEEVADVALGIAEGTGKHDLLDVEEILTRYKDETGFVDEAESHIISADLDEMLEKVVGGNGLDWAMPCLNEALGPLRKGDFIVVGARPDAGKTTFLATNAVKMAQHLAPDQKVIWFNNEEEGNKVKFRVVQAALRWTTADIKKDPKLAWEKYVDLMGGDKDKILVHYKSSGGGLHIKDIEAVLKNYNAGLIIIDQLRKVHGYEKAGNEAMRLQMLFQKARELSQEYAPVINVHQADGSAEGVKWIEMNQLQGSKTDIQGEADAMVMIGRTHEPGFEQSRFIYVPKNKLAGGDHSNPAMRNGKYEVLILPETAEFREVR